MYKSSYSTNMGIIYSENFNKNIENEIKFNESIKDNVIYFAKRRV